MRALLLIAIASCTPDIGSGMYLCGPNESCPDGQVCDGVTNTCVFEASAMPFFCRGNDSDHDPASASAIENVSCVSSDLGQSGCMHEMDAANWYSFTAPPECTKVAVNARVTFPVAFEPLGIVLGDAAGAPIAEDTECEQASLTGDAARCLVQTLVSGTSYTIAVQHAGHDNCDGDCSFNRYTFTVRFSTPL